MTRRSRIAWGAAAATCLLAALETLAKGAKGDDLGGLPIGEAGGAAPASEVLFGFIPVNLFWGLVALPIATLLAACIAYHPLRRRAMGVKKEELETPKALIFIAVAGVIIGAAVMIERTMAVAFFGFGSFIRFRTQVKNPKEVVIIFLCAGLGVLCGLHQFPMAVGATLFVWILIWFLDRGPGGNVERVTIVLKGLGTESQIGAKAYKEKLEKAGIEVVSSKVSLKKGNVTILMNKPIGKSTDEIEEMLLTGDDLPRPRSVEWIMGID